MFSEAGAAWHANASEVAAGPDTQVEVQRGWWSDVILNTTFWNVHPRMKAYFQFAWEKEENDGGIVDERDYRISNASDVLSAFLADWKPVQDLFVYGNSTLQAGQPAVNTSLGLNTPSGTIVTSTATVNQTDVITATFTNFVSDDMASTTTGISAAAETGTGLLGAPSQTTAANIFHKSAGTNVQASSLLLLAALCVALLL